MSGKYVPPSKREGYKPTSTELPPGHKPQCNPGPISSLFDLPQQGTFNYFSIQDPTNARGPGKPGLRERLPYDPDRGAEDTPLPPPPPPPAPDHPLGHLVVYIIVFKHAHPLWESHSELWSHTEAEKMIKDEESGGKKNFARPIPVFIADNRSRGATFHGWWKLDKMRVVEPGSDELKDLLETKDRANSYKHGRTPAAWASALETKWIKTRFSPIDTSDPRYANIKLGDPYTMTPGIELQRSVLEAGGLEEEVRVLLEEVPKIKSEMELERSAAALSI